MSSSDSEEDPTQRSLKKTFKYSPFRWKKFPDPTFIESYVDQLHVARKKGSSVDENQTILEIKTFVVYIKSPEEKVPKAVFVYKDKHYLKEGRELVKDTDTWTDFKDHTYYREYWVAKCFHCQKLERNIKVIEGEQISTQFSFFCTDCSAKKDQAHDEQEQDDL
jgi:hypothetical protein